MKTLGTIIDRMRAGGAPPTRHHNPYLAQALELDGTLFTQARLDDFFSLPALAGERALILEVGCYLGRSLIDFATRHPGKSFVGLDLTYKRTAVTARRVREAGVQGNAFVSMCAAVPFLEAAPAGRLSGTCVFFPDPWPRARDEKNRLLQEPFFRLLASRTSPNGFFWLKTDHAGYFAAAVETAQAAGWARMESEQAGIERFFSGIVPAKTVFEELFERKGEASSSAFLLPPAPRELS